MTEETVAKKSIFKKWWFWVLIIFILIVLAASGGSENSDSEVGNTDRNAAPALSENANPPGEKENENVYKAGQYKVGSDIPAGEYVLIANGAGYFEITSDSSGSFDSIIANDNFSSRSIITISDGQYINLNFCQAYPFAEAPAIEPKDGVLESGMYKVGVDIPAGEYKVEATSDMGYIEVTSSSNHNFESIVTNDNFQESKYITVNDGQYLKTNFAKIHLN